MLINFRKNNILLGSFLFLVVFALNNVSSLAIDSDEDGSDYFSIDRNRENMDSISNYKEVNLSLSFLQPSKIETFQFHQSISRLNLAQNELNDISFLSRFESLKSLDLSDNYLGNRSMETISRLVNLEKLDLSKNSFTRLNRINALTRLLDFSCNFVPLGDDGLSDIVDVGSVKFLSIRSIGFTYNKLADLVKMSGLESLDISGNQLSQENYCSLRRQMKEKNPRFRLYFEGSDSSPFLENEQTFSSSSHSSSGDSGGINEKCNSYSSEFVGKENEYGFDFVLASWTTVFGIAV